jgi:polyribonucleotide nucleotidyltransferase
MKFIKISKTGTCSQKRKEKVSRKALLPRPPRDENAPAREDRGPRPERRDDRK